MKLKQKLSKYSAHSIMFNGESVYSPFFKRRNFTDGTVISHVKVYQPMGVVGRFSCEVTSFIKQTIVYHLFKYLPRKLLSVRKWNSHRANNLLEQCDARGSSTVSTLPQKQHKP